MENKKIENRKDEKEILNNLNSSSKCKLILKNKTAQNLKTKFHIATSSAAFSIFYCNSLSLENVQRLKAIRLKGFVSVKIVKTAKYLEVKIINLKGKQKNIKDAEKRDACLIL